MGRIALGDFQITCVRDDIYHWDGGVIFGVVPKTLWSRKLPADELNRVAMGFNCYVVETGEHTILVETGSGDKMDARARERMSLRAQPRPLAAAIAEAGIDPERIDIVLNSHLHWDHCSGNTELTPAGPRPAFPRATYWTRKGEWEYAHTRHPRDSVSYIHANYDPLVESGRMMLIEDDREVVPGVWMRHAPGHNRDMTIITAASGGRTFCFFSDLVPTTAHLKPTWVMAFDLYPLETINQKMKWLGRAADERWVCGFGHDASVDFAAVARAGDSYELGHAAGIS